jgi:hypothetical protein
MSEKLKKTLSFLFIVLSIAAVVCIAFGNPELSDAWDALRGLDARWIIGLVFCWAAYAFFDALGTWLCLRKQGFSLGIGTVFSITLIGFYYSNITPGASGGQPMQVNSLRKAGVPVGNGTTAVTIRLIANQFMVSVLSLLFLLLNRSFVLSQLGGAIWFVRIGWIINFAVVPLVLLAAFCRGLVRKLASGLISLLAKIRLVKDREAATEKTAGVLDTYHTAIHDLFRSPAQLLLQCLCSTVSLLALTGSIVFVYYAFGLSGTSWDRLLTLSLLLFVSASYTPLPGASGAQEGGFMYYFNGIFAGGSKGLALLIWRFFTYYLFLFAGVVMVLLERFRLHRAAHTASGNHHTEDKI